MSRLSFDYLATIHSYETTGSSTSSPADCGERSFDDLLQRAQHETGAPAEPERSASDAARDSESNRSSQSASQDEEPASRSQPTDEESASAAAAAEAADSEEETAEAERADPDADDAQHERPQDQEDEEAAAVVVQVPPELAAGPAGELILSDAASTIAAGEAAPGEPGQPTGADPSNGTLPTDTQGIPGADVSLEAGEGQSSTESLSADPSGEVVEETPQQPAADVAGKRTPDTAAPEPATEDVSALPETTQQTEEQAAASAESVAAQSAADDNSRHDKTQRAGQTMTDNLQTPGDSRTQSPSASAEAFSPAADVATASLAPDPTTLSQDRTSEGTDAAAKTSPVHAAGETAPTARDAAAAQSATVSLEEGQQAGSSGEQVDRVRFVQRVARAFEAVGGDGGTIRLRLHPPELGSLRLDLTLRNGVMNAHLEADTSAARNLLLDNLPALRERLAEQNIKVDHFDVDLADQGTDSSWQQPSDQSRPEPRQTNSASRQRGQGESTVEKTTTVRTAPRYGDGSGFDVTI